MIPELHRVSFAKFYIFLFKKHWWLYLSRIINHEESGRSQSLQMIIMSLRSLTSFKMNAAQGVSKYIFVNGNIELLITSARKRSKDIHHEEWNNQNCFRISRQSLKD